MTAQMNLVRNMSGLTDTLTRISTGLRINSAKDDPAGLIASEQLRSQITASNAALQNTKRANGMVALADSALGQVGDLLNDIRGLVNQAASTGTMSADQIAANQLQVDATLDAIDRISQSTDYMGQKLLDGSLAFQTAGLNRSQLANLQINTANFGTADKLGVRINVQAAATSGAQVFNQAALGSDGATFKLTGNRGSQTFSFGANTTTTDMAEAINRVSDSTGVRAVAGSAANAGQIIVTSAGADNDIIITAKDAGFAAGNYAIKYTAGNSSGISYTITPPSGSSTDSCGNTNSGCGVIEFQLQMDPWQNAGNDRIDESSLGIYTKAVTYDGTNYLYLDSSTGANVTKVNWVFNKDTIPGSPTSVYDKNKGELTITLNDDGTTTIDEVVDAINKTSNATGLAASASGGAAVDAAAVSNYTIDVRSNNALNIQALTGDTKYNNTDVIYVQDAAAVTAAGGTNAAFSFVDQAQRASTSFASGGVNAAGVASNSFIQIQATQAGSAYNGYQFVFANDTTVTDGTFRVSTDATNKTITIAGNLGTSATDATMTLAQLRDAVQSVKDSNGQSLFSMTLYNADPTNNPTAQRTQNFSDLIDSSVFAGGVTAGTGVQPTNTATKTTGELVGQIGTDHAALIIAVNNATVTAQQVVDEFATTAPKNLQGLFSITNAQDSNGSGTLFADGTNFAAPLVPPTYPAPVAPATSPITDKTLRVFSGALTGGHNGNVSNTTAQQLIDFINNDATLSQLISATNAPNSQSGAGKLTLFNEVAYYGCPFNGNGIQFLGPDNSPNIQFVTNGANQDLSISFAPDITGDAKANLAAYNANASFSITADNSGSAYDDAVVRFKRVINNTQATTVGSTVTYSSGPSNAMAFGNLGGNLSDTTSGSDGTTPPGGFNGTFIFNALQGGENFNNVTIQATLDKSQTAAVAFNYNADTKTFNITVNDASVNLATVIDSFQKDPTNAALREMFSFELDYSDTYRDYAGSNDYSASRLVANDGSMNFASILGNSNTATLGNTGTTGGHAGGVIEVALYDDLSGVGPDGVSTIDPAATTIIAVADTALSGDLTVSTVATDANVVDIDSKFGSFQTNDIIKLINENPEIAKLFTAANYGASTGVGNIDFRRDTVGPVADPSGCGTVNAPRMVTSGGILEKGAMIVNLATDAYGNSITTAADLVNFMDRLTPEQTRGISASLIYPPGVTPSLCDASGGSGLLQSTISYDNCGNLIDNGIQFTSCGSQVGSTKPLSEIVAVNGANAGFTLLGKNAGTELEGTTLRYVALTDSNVSPYADFDTNTNQITVFVNPGTTTANDVKNIIATSAATRNLFEVQLRSDGSGLVNLTDDSISLAGGLYQAGYKGGASMLWNTDDTSNQMILESVDVGSKQFVQIDVISGTFNTVDSVTGQTQSRSYGTDTVATANGQKMQSDGRNISLSTTNLSFSATVGENAQSGDSYTFDIVSGGAVIQLGPDVISAQQYRFGIPSVATTDLGGISGRMSDLRSGGAADLSTNTSLADRIVQEAITAVASTRGRLGAIQKSTFDTNIVTLENSIEQLTAARSDIVDADFATESSNLTRYQILVQSGTKVLGIANQLPQYAASLLG
ncbi:MAG: flagellin [Planctomycetaceae bacterium]|nr:flagellin [Planctomycetaceae bacterium]